MTKEASFSVAQVNEMCSKTVEERLLCIPGFSKDHKDYEVMVLAFEAIGVGDQACYVLSREPGVPIANVTEDFMVFRSENKIEFLSSVRKPVFDFKPSRELIEKVVTTDRDLLKRTFAPDPKPSWLRTHFSTPSGRRDFLSFKRKRGEAIYTAIDEGNSCD